MAKEYRGWSITWDYGEFCAVGPNYDASYEGPEDGWVDNGERVYARTYEDIQTEVDNLLRENCAHCDNGLVWNNADPTSGQCVPCEQCAPPEHER